MVRKTPVALARVEVLDFSRLFDIVEVSIGGAGTCLGAGSTNRSQSGRISVSDEPITRRAHSRASAPGPH